MVLLMILYKLCGLSIVMVMLIMFLKFDYIILMLFELYTILFLYLVLNEGSSYERGNANVYLIVFRYVIRFGVVMSNSLSYMRLMLLILGIAKLPVFGLHMWLPKVHVEASMLRSIVLAGGVLKLGIIYYWNFGVLILVGVIVVISLYSILTIVDGKRFAAYSSVLHITSCVLVRLVIMLLVRYIHIVISPLIFMTVYICYMNSGSRYFSKIGFLVIVLWMVNFGLPFLGSFFAEVYLIINSGIILMMLIVIYIVCGYVIIKSINDVGFGNFYIPWLVLYILVI